MIASLHHRGGDAGAAVARGAGAAAGAAGAAAAGGRRRSVLRVGSRGRGPPRGRRLLNHRCGYALGCGHHRGAGGGG